MTICLSLSVEIVVEQQIALCHGENSPALVVVSNNGFKHLHPEIDCVFSRCSPLSARCLIGSCPWDLSL
jgi:hypothetical protein